MKRRILVVDDEAVVRRSVCRIFEGTDFEVETVPSGRGALEAIQQRPFHLVITDLKMPGMNGIEVLKAIRVLQPGTPVILITGYATVDTAVECMKSGAVEYIPKPFTPDLLLEKVHDTLARAAALHAPAPDTPVERIGEIVGRSSSMQEVYQRILRVAPTDSTVLITGESGTGKELVARAIHDHSARKNKSFVAVDCTALAENLLESELFGHVKGSFTGAIRTKTGLFKVADGGTLFLDEISNLSATTQAKLLRVLQEREITPIGGTTPSPIDIRLVVATNQDLKERVDAGAFREDLYFRLNIIPISLPPLRDRQGDVEALTTFFLGKYAAETGKCIRGISGDAMLRLETYPFPGNVRELENIIERAVVLCQGELVEEADLELPTRGFRARCHQTGTPRTAEELKLAKRVVKDDAVLPVERAFALDALRRNDWNVTRAAQDTGMLRPNFQALLRKLEISPMQRRNQEETSAAGEHPVSG
ncbi:MAG TPA: sigma-54 dependent transcriptional regulator [Deferrisomatales bacterium]|nr:sigma-54 dependent transcriptional regulator [Deferrisomatales bacterium]